MVPKPRWGLFKRSSRTPGGNRRRVSPFFRRLDHEGRGAIAIIMAIVIVLLVSVAALVVDASDAEVTVRGNQSKADFAALAAAHYLPGNPLGACDAAWNYVRANIPGLPSTPSPCSPPPPSPCLPTTGAWTNAVTSAGFTITFTYPVPDGHPALQGRIGSEDGEQCERFAVSVVSQRSSILAGIFGSSGLTARGGAVSRGFIDYTDDIFVALLVFDPYGCEPLLAQGSGGGVGGIEVFQSTDNNVAGVIGVDSNGSDGSCNGAGSFTVDAEGSNAHIWACGQDSDTATRDCRPGGIIALHSMFPGQVGCTPGNVEACDPSDEAAGRLYPSPTRLPVRLTRAAIDHRYNCLETYPDYLGIPIDGCDDWQTMPPYIDQLRAYVGDTGWPGGGPQAGWTRWSSLGLPCDLPSSAPPVVVTGNIWVDCPQPLTIRTSVEFRGGNVVFDNGLGLTAQGSITINNPAFNVDELPDNCLTPNNLCGDQSADSQAYVYIRRGGFDRSGQAPLRFEHVMMYIDPGSGFIDLAGGSGAFYWTSPAQEETDPITQEVHRAPFDDLILHSESSRSHSLAGQSNQVLEGTTFTPYALFVYTGQGNQDQINAQFLSWRLRVAGRGVLQMRVHPGRATPFPFQVFLLIR